MTTTLTFRSASHAILAGAVTFTPIFGAVEAQVAIKRTPSGFNLFSVRQDVDVGRQSALELERQARLVTSARTTQFLDNITALLAARVRDAAYPFQVKAINSAGIDLFVLPGGPIYVS